MLHCGVIADGDGCVGPHPILTVAFLEPGEEDEIAKWYQEEHLAELTKVPGYKRSRLFISAPPMNKDGTTPKYCALHEWESIASVTSPELRATVSTEWAKKVLGGAKTSHMGSY